ncbi:MAG: hypothetical protein VX181_16735, partial [Pseudomonadota bacterium]|nr:hypothetical protein [Pseudomonadota bacterium]
MTALEVIQARAPGVAPKVGFVLGSGLGGLAEHVEGVSIDYADLPGFPHVGVSGHKAQLHLGRFEGCEVAILGGREHFYENGNAAAMRLPLEVLKALGVTAAEVAAFGRAVARGELWSSRGHRLATFDLRA